MGVVVSVPYLEWRTGIRVQVFEICECGDLVLGFGQILGGEVGEELGYCFGGFRHFVRKG